MLLVELFCFRVHCSEECSIVWKNVPVLGRMFLCSEECNGLFRGCRNSQCETAVRVFRRCQMDRVQVIKECSPVLTRNQLINCLNKYNQDPMDVFVYCLKYKCLGQNDKCDVMKDALEGCANIPALPANGNCP